MSIIGTATVDNKYMSINYWQFTLYLREALHRADISFQRSAEAVLCISLNHDLLALKLFMQFTDTSLKTLQLSRILIGICTNILKQCRLLTTTIVSDTVYIASNFDGLSVDQPSVTCQLLCYPNHIIYAPICSFW